MDILNLILHNFFAFIVIISIIVFVHEYGHYWVAKKCGVTIESFSIGFGKEIFGWTNKAGTRWKISMIPLGGYVKMLGDENAASVPDNEKLNTMSDEERKGAFPNKKLWQRFAIVFAGPAANYIFAAAIFTGFFAYYGEPDTLPIAGKIVEKSEAARVGLQEGDVITNIDGTAINSFQDMVEIISIHADITLPLTYERDGQLHTVDVTPQNLSRTDSFGNEVKIGVLGVHASGQSSYREVGTFESLSLGVEKTISMSESMLNVVWQIITGQRNANQLSGAIRIADYAGKSFERGLETALWFMAIISVNLGLVNLFPIPMLDGGHLMLYTIEGMLRKPLSEKAQEVMFRLGFSFLIFLMGFAIFNDLRHYGVF